MTERSAVRRRFQFSLLSLLIVTGLLALLLVPVARQARQREQVQGALKAAQRSLDLEKSYRAGLNERKAAEVDALDRGGLSEAPRPIPPATAEMSAQLERLRQENAELRNTVKDLRREIQRLKPPSP